MAAFRLKPIMRSAISAFALYATASSLALAGPVTWDMIQNANDHKEVLTYGFGLNAQRFTTMSQINNKNVEKLEPVWSFSFGDEKQRGQESQALVHDGVIYVTASYSRIFALDQKSGKKLWSYTARLPDDIRPCCDVVNRGAAIFGDKVYMGLLDASIVALNKDTGKVVWHEKFGDQKIGYTMTGAPLVIKDQKSGKMLLIPGSSGAEFGVKGYRVESDPATGKEIWRRPMVEGSMGTVDGKDTTTTGNKDAPSWPHDADGKLKESWYHGGGAPWQSPVFEPGSNTIIVGTGNPAPWNTWARTPGDSLFTSGQAYVDASDGTVKGFYQHTPNDAWDFSGNNEIVLFDFKDKSGKMHKAGAHADRNGFFFVTDREKLSHDDSANPNKPTALLNAFPFVDNITWAKEIDLKTGRPVEVDGQRPPLPEEGQDKGKSVEISPPFLGGKNWEPMSYSPDTGMFYIPANNWKEDYWSEKVVYKPGAAYLGMGFRIKRMYPDSVGTLRAYNPTTGKMAWEHKEAYPLWSGTLATHGDLVFAGTSDGYFKAFDAKNGKELWKFQTGSGVVGCPISWEADGKQYIGVTSGYGGAVPLWGGDMAELTKRVSQGGSFWVFAIAPERKSASN